MKRIMKYKIFETSEEFEIWQVANDFHLHGFYPTTVSTMGEFDTSRIIETVPPPLYNSYNVGIIIFYSDKLGDECESNS